mmetsp:Transcript_38337/g.120707  ORF Transcript_38337/g.120707 Transcript_38337/m.120707 type:complete len:613 (-) Transcript_38337:2059-3897(-)
MASMMANLTKKALFMAAAKGAVKTPARNIVSSHVEGLTTKHMWFAADHGKSELRRTQPLVWEFQVTFLQRRGMHILSGKRARYGGQGGRAHYIHRSAVVEVPTNALIRFYLFWKSKFGRVCVGCTTFAIGMTGLGLTIKRMQGRHASLPWLVSKENSVAELTVPVLDNTGMSSNQLWVEREISVNLMVQRIFRHIFIFFPLAVSYLPFRLLGGSALDLWWRWAIAELERSGPAFVKLGQWAATRTDIFPQDLCSRLSILHSNAQTHDIESSLDDLLLLMRNSGYQLLSLDKTPIGSGCIAQVHRAVIMKDDEPMKVAIKIIHPEVPSTSYADIHLMLSLATLVEKLPRLRWLSLRESVEEFAGLMQNQIDLRVEANNLEMFSQNFKSWEEVKFPLPIRPLVSENILVETLQDGIPLAELISGNLSDQTDIRRKVADIGMRAFLAMCFKHNFIHGDLHPGNVLVSFGEDNNGPIRVSFLDAGITSQLSDRDKKNFVALFGAVVQRDGRLAAQLMLENARDHACDNVEAFCDGMERLVNDALGRGLVLGKFRAGQILAQAFTLACLHRVKIESNFAAVCLAVMVLDGVGRELDPSLDLLQMAAPIVLRQLIDRR